MPEPIAFIINPISGNKSKRNIETLISSRLDNAQFTPHIFFTEYRGHGTDIARYCLENEILKIVAVGGDGTVNEIGRSLIHTDGVLGIIPFGSGNGLARHLKIPLDTGRAIEVINENSPIKMDIGYMNEVPFFCTSGVGFDAYIGKMFGQKSKRGFQTYLKTTISEFIHYKPHDYKINYEGKEIQTKAFLITIGNTSQYGNNAFICPYADVQDGLLDVSIIVPFSKVFALDLGRRLFNGTIDRSRYTKTFQTRELRITRNDPGPVHIDGEPYEMGEEIRLKIAPSSLQVLV